ncbi:hypothetical protein AMS64_22000 [Aeromonas veronii]|uniref:hypothetical protein n=1 Tax=Aeromonas veronii TaxID=654 RepID=UPI00078C0218|nr:hypothetical protein [Aeromonas veronii]AMQ44835.1 hypothetical protein AMS64_22000 [Aeromonas veronii]MCX0428007.1 hypothetical protein [Aeromonas veronii]MCX0447300.1 hypothetical protein [Aeromonas veronii]POG17277.1 hypothetical protein C2849_20170 [Aeromonas veronii]
MSTYKTHRGTVLSACNCNHIPDSDDLKRIALAANDYRVATLNPTFAQDNGGVEALRHDLFLFVEQWLNELEIKP